MKVILITYFGVGSPVATAHIYTVHRNNDG